MITIPTRELIGSLSDVIPFAGTDPDYPATNRVRIEWDGEQLHALATDGYRMARCTWNPDDEHDDTGVEEGVTFGGEDTAPFSVRIDLEDAKNIAKAFKLRGVKRQNVPVTIAVTPESLAENTYTLRLSRAGAAAWSPLRFEAAGVGAPRAGNADDWPELPIHDLIAKYTEIAGQVETANYNPKFLAAFAKVRAHGEYGVHFAFTGDGKPTRFEIGSRVVGLLQPIRPIRVEDAAPASAEFAAAI